MFKFVIGICTVIAGVAATEGTADLSTAILLATVGSMIMVWSLYDMSESGDLG